MANTLLKLNTGATIPALGFGTWQAPEDQVRESVAHAIKSGYRHIDAAFCYGNEGAVGQGLKEGLEATGLQRSDIFITTKLWCTYHTRVEEALDKSLKSLGVEYVDLYLLHWPIAMNPNGNHELFPKLADGSRDLVPERSHVDTYKDMEKLIQTGKTKAIGVCNYSVRFLEELLPQVSIVPAVNQIENHPSLPQSDITEYCKQKGILITAYSPLGSTGGPLMKYIHVTELAQKKNTTPGCILLSYHVSQGHAVLAKSVTPARIEENTKIVDLSSEDLAKLSEISKAGVTRFVYPAFGVDFGFPDKSPNVAVTA